MARGAWLLGGAGWALAGWIAATPPRPAQAAGHTLQRSEELRKQFPFISNCAGNTQEMVACLWDQRNRDDGVLGSALGENGRLEEWRASRRKVCEVAANKGKGGSIHPILWLSCENALNRQLLQLLKQPLLPDAGP